MSDYEQHVGRIKPVSRKYPESFEDYVKRVFGDRYVPEKWREGMDVTEYIFECDLDEIFFYANDTFYEVVETKEIDDTDDLQELLPQPDGSYVFVMRFYNGGTCLQEMMEEALEKLPTSE